MCNLSSQFANCVISLPGWLQSRYFSLFLAFHVNVNEKPVYANKTCKYCDFRPKYFPFKLTGKKKATRSRFSRFPFRFDPRLCVRNTTPPTPQNFLAAHAHTRGRYPGVKSPYTKKSNPFLQKPQN